MQLALRCIRTMGNKNLPTDKFLKALFDSIVEMYLSHGNAQQRERLDNTCVKPLVPVRTLDNDNFDLDELDSQVVSPASVTETGDTWTICIHPNILLQFLQKNTGESSVPRPSRRIPLYVIEYLIFHEAIHIFLGDTKHSKDFLWLEKRYDERVKAREWLKINGFGTVEEYL